MTIEAAAASQKFTYLNTIVANVANTVEQQTFLNTTTTGQTEASRITSSFSDIGQTTNNSTWEVSTRVANVLAARLKINAAGVVTDGADQPFLTSAGGSPEFTGSVSATSATLVLNQRLEYNPAAGQTYTFPASPSLNDKVSIKNVTTTITNITLTGDGTDDIENPNALGNIGNSFVFGGAAGEGLDFEWDNTAWRIV